LPFAAASSSRLYFCKSFLNILLLFAAAAAASVARMDYFVNYM